MSPGLRFARRMDSIQLEFSLIYSRVASLQGSYMLSISIFFVISFQLSEMLGVRMYIRDFVSVGESLVARQ